MGAQRRILSALIVLFVVSLVGCSVSPDSGKQNTNAQFDYPEKAIQLIIPYAAGGGTDLNGRTIEKYAEKYLGVPVAVINKPGAASAVGVTELAKAKPDGYTIGYTCLPSVPQLVMDGGVEFTLDDFEPIVGQVIEPKYLVVSANSPYETVGELIDYAINNPGEVIAADNGPGSHNELVMKGFASYVNIEMTHVPFDGGAAMKTAILGGHADCASLAASEFDSQLKPLVIFAEERSKAYPDCPTSFEEGINLDMSARRCLQAPKGTPAEIIEYLVEKFELMFKDPDYIADMERTGSTPIFLRPQEVEEAIRADMKFLEEFKSEK